MLRNTGVVIAALFVSLLWSANVSAQATAQISGSVKDPSGAVLPGVDVTVTQTDTGITRSTVTNETGSYVLPNLALGPYRLEATLSGFRTYIQTGIVLQVNSSPVVDVALQLGQLAEQVQVQATAPLVETRNPGVGQVMENQRILELPLNGRQVTDLITLAGGAVQSGAARANNSGQMNGSPYIAVAGGLGFGIDYTLDGANHVNFINATTMPIPFPDALQEFKVETGGLSAQHGKETSVNAVTKSGTNAFHGDVFEFHRNDAFNAKRFFAAKRSTLKRNQFGGTVGGPVLKNRIFFFGGVQDTTLREDPADVRAFLPTASALAGDWNALTSPLCNAGRPVPLRGAFVNNTIDPSRYSPAALQILRRLNQVGPEPCGEITFGRRNVQDEKQYIGRLDYQLTGNQSFFGRYVGTKLDIALPLTYTPNNLLNTASTGQDNMAHSLAVGHTSVFGSNMVNELRASYNYLDAVVVGPKVFSACDVGVRMYCGDFPDSISMTITGGFNVGSRFPDPGNPRGGDKWKGNSVLLSDDVTLVRGRHQMGAGGSLLRGQHLTFSRWWGIGNMGFTGAATGLGLADFLTGQMSTFTTAAAASHELTQFQAALNARDIWQVNSRVTLNYGVRWEPYLPQSMGHIYAFDLDKFKQGVKSTVFKNAPAGFSYLGDPGFPGGKSGINKRWSNFSPRAGVAWDVNGDGRTSVRASWAYQYDFVAALWREDYSVAAPWGNYMTVNGVSLDNPWGQFPGGNPFPAQLGADVRFVPYTSFEVIPPDVHTPQTQSWNVTLQRQFGKDWGLTASYIGTHSSHIWAQQNLNPAVFIPGGPCTLNGVSYNPCSSAANTNERRRLTLLNPTEGQFIGALAMVDDSATQDYNSLLLSAQRRVSNGIALTGNYTLSHCYGDYADLTSQGPDANETYTHPDDLSADRANCDTDRRHVVNLTAVAETPQFSNDTVRMVASGWRVAGIYRWSSGAPINITTGTDRALTGGPFNASGQVFQRANQILDDPFLDKSGRPNSRWINSAAFSLPDLGTFGTAKRNSATAPPTWSFDMAVSRVFSVGKTERLEARLEGYNVTNAFRPRLTSPQALTSSTFGVIRDSYDPRILQFALKYMF